MPSPTSRPAASTPSTAQRVVSYWRDSLADGSRQDVARGTLEQVVGDAAFAVPRDLLRDGVVPELEPQRTRIREIFRAAARGSRDEGARDDAPSCRVLVCPFVVRAAVRHGVRRASDDFVVPLWIPAVLSRDGRLAPAPDAAPWIPRDRLEPGRDTRPVVLGSVDAVDRFLSAAEPPDAGAGWAAYWAHAWKMLEAVGADAGWTLAADGFDLGALRLARRDAYVTLPTGFIVPQAPPVGMVEPLMAVYEHVLRDGAVPPLLERFAAVAPREQAPPLDDEARLRAHALHLGQMSDVHALAPSQREALHHALRLDDGDLLAINGPPGTGKTTLIQSVVASLWVRAALDQGEPPVIVATSTNNQAVTNVIDSFGKAAQAESPLAGRWLPEVSSF
ncbi:MAG TPA: AAA domain-containing protein, partial [Longimicrobium sp.]|nr:AAA domain-containing protein [Longimicrobium sp.]